MGKTFIYALCEPGTGDIRYVGKANHPERRFKRHLKESMGYSSYLGRWLRDLLSRGESPFMEILDEVPDNQHEFWEREYIRVFREIGMRLVNTTDGGEGGAPAPRSLEWRAHISAALSGEKNPRFGTPASLETRAKMSATRLGGKRSGASSLFLGVGWLKRLNKWRVRTTVNGKGLHLGLFSDETEAARAYDVAALKVYGPTAKLNFPDAKP